MDISVDLSSRIRSGGALELCYCHYLCNRPRYSPPPSRREVLYRFLHGTQMHGVMVLELHPCTNHILGCWLAVLISLSHAIGTVFMPPKWSLGYHQCRWSYDSEERVLEVARKFREKGIPCDERFPDPKSLVKDLHHIGFKAIWMLDPGIKHEKGYFVYDSGTEHDAWIQEANGMYFVGDVWPGPCVFPDFTQSKIRSWWANLVRDFISNGVDGIWNDMNEPAIFKAVTKTMPESNIHRGDNELGGHQSHAHYHNAYGMLMARSTYEGMELADKRKRPFVLTRAGFIGSQRYAAMWTGDNLSNWEHLHMSISMVLQLGLSGQPLSGPDIGGFAGNATPKLFGRWMGFGAMFPFCRGHSETDTINHEPWSFGEELKYVLKQEGLKIIILQLVRLSPKGVHGDCHCVWEFIAQA
ncbi:Glycoside hydrolase family 31 - like 4 [Theobroma cacao]|nr:Glycoside hydrolase family 31 - like 4 [Theobroma cacao]